MAFTIVGNDALNSVAVVVENVLVRDARDAVGDEQAVESARCCFRSVEVELVTSCLAVLNVGVLRLMNDVLTCNSDESFGARMYI